MVNKRMQYYKIINNPVDRMELIVGDPDPLDTQFVRGSGTRYSPWEFRKIIDTARKHNGLPVKVTEEVQPIW